MITRKLILFFHISFLTIYFVYKWDIYVYKTGDLDGALFTCIFSSYVSVYISVWFFFLIFNTFSGIPINQSKVHYTSSLICQTICYLFFFLQRLKAPDTLKWVYTLKKKYLACNTRCLNFNLTNQCFIGYAYFNSFIHLFLFKYCAHFLEFHY